VRVGDVGGDEAVAGDSVGAEGVVVVNMIGYVIQE
jgi:hypothetical protein